MWHNADEKRVPLISSFQPSLLFFYIANLKLHSVQFNVFWTFTVKHSCAWKEQWSMKHGKNQEMVKKKKKTWYIPNAIHTSKSRQRALERQFFWHWLVPHSCQSRRVVFIFMLQQKTGKQGERQLKRPWPEPYAIAVTFIAYHFKTVQKALLFGHVNQLRGLSSPALPNNPRWFCPIWISFPPLCLSHWIMSL